MKKQKLIWLMKRYLFFLICLLGPTYLMAQSINVTGTVVDEQSEPIIGASISVKGSAIGTVSDEEGRFSLNVPDENSVLTVFSMTYLSQDVKVGPKRNFTIVLEEDRQLLEEVVVVGYGVQKKVNLTGAVAAVTSSELNARIAPSTTSLLQGRVPGLQITQNSAMPGSEGIEMRIRGMSTFSSAGNNPLVLIDGVEGDMNKLNPNMIESVSVLKDASSAAIYGSRAANGVVLVTTKAGNEGRLNVDYSFNYTIQKPTKPMDRPELLKAIFRQVLWDGKTMSLINENDNLFTRIKYEDLSGRGNFAPLRIFRK